MVNDLLTKNGILFYDPDQSPVYQITIFNRSTGGVKNYNTGRSYRLIKSERIERFKLDLSNI